MIDQQKLAQNYRPPRQRAGVLTQPDVHHAMLRGIDKFVAAIQPTLGPRPRIVGIERSTRDTSPELLDDGAVIARRIIELPDQYENIGAMLLRGILWLGTTDGALHSRANPQVGWMLAQQWQSPINAICAVGERIAVLHGGTVSFGTGGGGFEDLPYSDVTSIRWLEKTRLCIGSDTGSVQIIEMP